MYCPIVPANSPDSTKFSVYVYRLDLKLALLPGDQNSYETVSITSTSDFVNCFHSEGPGCLVTATDNDFFSVPNLDLMSRLFPVVMVTHSAALTDVISATKNGAYSVLRVFSDQESICKTVRDACNADISGENSPWVMRKRIANLTGKERQVIYLSIRGRTTKTISGDLGVCHQTIDKHKKRALSKLNASSVVELINMLMDAQALTCGVGSKRPIAQKAEIAAATCLTWPHQRFRV